MKTQNSDTQNTVAEAPVKGVGTTGGSADHFCRKFCTRKLGWNAAKREECRSKTACDEYRGHSKPNANDPGRSP